MKTIEKISYRIVRQYANGRHVATLYYASTGRIYREIPGEKVVTRRDELSEIYERDTSGRDYIARLKASGALLSETYENVHLPTRDRRGGSLAGPAEAPETTTYKAGTRLGDVEIFDRELEVTFHCPEHEKATYRSRDPYISSWITRDRNSDLCTRICDVKIDDMLLAADYTVKDRL